MKTLGQVMEERREHTSGFDYLRLMLAISVVIVHSAYLSYKTQNVHVLGNGWVGVVSFLILPLFFALSGFLVAASLYRVKNIWIFIGLRGLRILPALMVEVCLSACILGPWLTSFSLRDYISNPLFARYFLNLIGDVQFKLPGVFLHNPSFRVNGSLWTVPFEAKCYILLFVAAYAKLTDRPMLCFKVLMALCCLCFFMGGMFHDGAFRPGIVTELRIEGNENLHVPGSELVLFFLGGSILYMLRHQIVHSVYVFLLSAIFFIYMIKTYTYTYFTIFPVAYIIAYIGLMNPKKLPVLFSGDYSYGIYLYGFPIQQTLVMLLPSVATIWYMNLLMAFPIILLFAAASWHFVEEPLLGLKRLLYKKSKA